MRVKMSLIREYKVRSEEGGATGETILKWINGVNTHWKAGRPGMEYAERWQKRKITALF